MLCYLFCWTIAQVIVWMNQKNWCKKEAKQKQCNFRTKFEIDLPDGRKILGFKIFEKLIKWNEKARFFDMNIAGHLATMLHKKRARLIKIGNLETIKMKI